jgi:hypothetical protein
MRVYIVVRKSKHDVEKGINICVESDKHRGKQKAEILDAHEKKHNRHNNYHIIEKFDVIATEDSSFFF